MALAGEGIRCDDGAGDCGPAPCLPAGNLELLEWAEPGPDLIKLGWRSGEPLAYMNLLAEESGVAEASGGEKGADGTEVGGLGLGGRLLPLA